VWFLAQLARHELRSLYFFIRVYLRSFPVSDTQKLSNLSYLTFLVIAFDIDPPDKVAVYTSILVIDKYSALVVSSYTVLPLSGY
jgi:hypothetical protein